MIIIVLIWIVLGIGAFFPLCLSIWRMRRYRAQVAVRLLQISLAGVVFYSGIATALSFSALLVTQAIDRPVTAGVVLLTVAELARTLPMIVLALYSIGLFPSSEAPIP